MISSLKRKDLYVVSIGLAKESYENENVFLNDGDRDFGTICLALSPSLRYLVKSVEYPKDVWKKLDRNFGNNKENYNRTLEITPRTTIFPYSKFSTSTISNEVFQDEEGAESSSQSILIEESLLAVTPSPTAP